MDDISRLINLIDEDFFLEILEREELKRETLKQAKIVARIQRRKEREKQKWEEECHRRYERRKYVLREKERKQMLYEDNRMKEINDSTHAFFRIYRLDPIGKKVKKQETGVVYFGDTIPSPSSHGQQKIKFCIPHGKGKLILENGDILYEGGFDHGKMHGNGTYLFSNGDRWIDGMFQLDRLNGIGIYEFHNLKDKGKASKDAIYQNNRRICFTDELQPGITIKWKNCYSNDPEQQSAILLKKGMKRGHYKVKLYNGKIRSVNLTEIKFELDSTKVRVVPLEMIFHSDENIKQCQMMKNKKVCESSLAQRYPHLTNSANVYDVENFFYDETRNEKELMDSNYRKEKEMKGCEYLQHLKELENEKSRIIIRKERVQHNKRKEEFEKKSIKDALLMEIVVKTMQKKAKQMEDEKVALSRHQASDYKRGLGEENWIF